MTTIISANPTQPEYDAVQRAAATLAAGLLVILPTDTVYGLACRADDPAAVRALFAAKGRPPTKPLPLLLASPAALECVSSDLPPAAHKLAAAFWPGPLTVVVTKSAQVNDLVTGGQRTVGVRVPDLPLTQTVLAACDFAVAVTSANLADEPPAIGVAELPAVLLAAVSLVLDAGPCRGEVPSTVVDATTVPPRVLREGPVTATAIERAIGE